MSVHPQLQVPLLSRARPRLLLSPFPHGYVDDFLVAEEYRGLARDFLDPANHEAMDVLKRGKKRVVFRTAERPALLDELSPAWRAFIETISSQAFMRDCLDWVKRMLPLESLPTGPYRELMARRLAVGPESLEMQCEFASLEPGIHLPPHSDSTDKIISCVYYFAPEDWRTEWGGGTEVYRPLNDAQTNNWSNFIEPASAMRLESRCEFRPNRLFFFVKAHNAWHGIAPLKAPPGRTRRSFNFALCLRPEALQDPAVSALERCIHQTEKAQFAA